MGDGAGSDAHGDGVVFAAEPAWHIAAQWADPGGGAFGGLGQFAELCLILHVDVGQQLLQVGADQDQPFLLWSLFEFKNTFDGVAIKWIAAETKDSLGGVGDNTARAKGANGLADLPGVRQSICSVRGRRRGSRCRGGRTYPSN